MMRTIFGILFLSLYLPNFAVAGQSCPSPEIDATTPPVGRWEAGAVMSPKAASFRDALSLAHAANFRFTLTELHYSSSLRQESGSVLGKHAQATSLPIGGGRATTSAGSNRIIPDGIYVAPVGGSIEVIQILGGRIALKPRTYLTEATFNTTNAVLVGSFDVVGNSAAVTWNDGTSRSGTFKLDGNCVSWGYIYCRAKPFRRGERLDGRYVGAATAGGGVVSRSAELVLRPDGRFSLSTTGSINAPSGTSGAASSSVPGQEGWYEIDGWTLRLQSISGLTRDYLTFPYDLYGPADPIYFDGGFMRKRQ